MRHRSGTRHSPDKLRVAKSTAPRPITLMYVPTTGEPKRLVTSAKTLRGLCAVLILFLTFVSWLAYSWHKQGVELAELRYLHSVAEEQKAELKALQEQTRTLTERLRQLEILETKIRQSLEAEGVLSQSFISSALGVASRETATLPSRSSDAVRIANRDIGRVIQLSEQEIAELDNSLSGLESRYEDLDSYAKEVVRWLRAQPNIWPTRGSVTSNFGWRRHPITGRYEFHPALDIAAPYGTPIVAAADGRVEFAGYRSGYGRTVVINHGYGIKTLYAHCSTIKVRYGQNVVRGQLIATVGDSGTATGPHLHYEIHVSGVAVNPFKYLK
ncbi:MAG TPA: peptidoglycan DD-metalloendopeptidase family protein [Firmicutes bacterium]|nr:peptidoglycan DD-metalloendopeptidase family protein [Candidatus Fermentithermobacillaceae bacterium]